MFISFKMAFKTKGHTLLVTNNSLYFCYKFILNIFLIIPDYYEVLVTFKSSCLGLFCFLYFDIFFRNHNKRKIVIMMMY